MSDEGGFDLSALLEQAQAMQDRLMAAQEAQADEVVTGSAAGGKVTVDMTGAGQFRSVHIDPDVVDPSDVELLEDLVLAALRNAAEQVMALQSQLQEESLGGLDLGGLGGLPGL